jgi:hypothetical protein
LDLKSSDTYRALMEEEYMPTKSKEFKPPAAKAAPPPKVGRTCAGHTVTGD